MTTVSGEHHIRSAPCSACAVCGSPGAYLYRDQIDRLFGASGTWDLRKCSNADCGLLWLDPMPLPEDLGNAYLNYYTHRRQGDSAAAGAAKRFYHLMKRAYWASQYNYPADIGKFSSGFLAALLRLFPIRRGDVDAEVRFLPALEGGQLLDVGCGSGEWLLTMRGLGWRVQGVDFDAKAAELAESQGLNVRAGSVEQQEYPDGTFDAVTLNHVIEHVPDPLGTLAECARILKPGGQVVVATPNNASLGHRCFKENWRGLEPPRHLHIFSPQSLRQVLAQAGYKRITVHQQIANSVTCQSALLWRGAQGGGEIRRAIAPSVIARLFSLWELPLPRSSPSVGDCMTALAAKV
jgi:2-polyprenyl-3-methyl-5-hydroxy-6-metoxy-1,4-benzoquinol methylase